jgi:hypothetical protein
MSGGDQMSESNGDLAKLEEKYLGPDYNYSKNIYAPTPLGMSSNGTMEALADDIGGLMAYVQVLVTGRSNASVTGGPLGGKFFLETPLKCNDTATGNEVVRSIYINNVPDGQIPFISEAMGGGGFTEFLGLVPGIISNMAQIHPMGILSAFTAGGAPDCQGITMQTIDASNVSGSGTAFVSHTDINLMNPAWFPSGSRPELIMTHATKTKQKKESGGSSQGFTTMHDNNATKKNKKDYSKMPDDLLIKLYYSALGLIGIYLLLKIFLKKKMFK